MAKTEGKKQTGGEEKSPNAGLTEVGQIAVTVEDVERATAFYAMCWAFRSYSTRPGSRFSTSAGYG